MPRGWSAKPMTGRVGEAHATAYGVGCGGCSGATLYGNGVPSVSGHVTEITRAR